MSSDAKVTCIAVVSTNKNATASWNLISIENRLIYLPLKEAIQRLIDDLIIEVEAAHHECNPALFCGCRKTISVFVSQKDKWNIETFPDIPDEGCVIVKGTLVAVSESKDYTRRYYVMK